MSYLFSVQIAPAMIAIVLNVASTKLASVFTCVSLRERIAPNIPTVRITTSTTVAIRCLVTRSSRYLLRFIASNLQNQEVVKHIMRLVQETRVGRRPFGTNLERANGKP